MATHTGRRTYGHPISDATAPVPLENVHTDYSDEDSRIEFRLSNGNKIFLFFPSEGGSSIYWEVGGSPVSTPAAFRRAFPMDIQVVPVLGPLEQDETIVRDETVRRGSGTSRASRHFRNYWYKNPDGFERFNELIEQTWKGMSIKRPEVASYLEQRLAMFCCENRVDRELYWSGFGFQVWCQLLTHISRNQEADLLIVDEPEIYLHPDVQRQLLSILRHIRPDILLATHSPEILGEADPSEILMIDKTKRSGKRLRDIEGVQTALNAIGSVQNITLTQLARNRKIIFVEGMDDFMRIRRFARVIGLSGLAAGTDVTVLESGGYSSWQRVRSLAWGLRGPLKSPISMAAVYDRDYWADEEVENTLVELRQDLDYAHIHARKEMENYLLVPVVLERALTKMAAERRDRQECMDETARSINVSEILDTITTPLKPMCQGQYSYRYCEFKKREGRDQATLMEEALRRFEEKWERLDSRMEVVPGKDVLRELRAYSQSLWKVTLTDIRIIDSFKKEEVPADLAVLLHDLENFRVA